MASSTAAMAVWRMLVQIASPMACLESKNL